MKLFSGIKERDAMILKLQNRVVRSNGVDAPYQTKRMLRLSVATQFDPVVKTDYENAFYQAAHYIETLEHEKTQADRRLAL